MDILQPVGTCKIISPDLVDICSVGIVTFKDNVLSFFSLLIPKPSTCLDASIRVFTVTFYSEEGWSMILQKSPSMFRILMSSWISKELCTSFSPAAFVDEAESTNISAEKINCFIEMDLIPVILNYIITKKVNFIVILA